MGVPTKADMFICDGHTYQSWHVRLRWGNPVLAAHSMHAEEIQRNTVHSQHLEVTQESVSSSGCEAEASTRCGTHYPDRAGLEQNPCCLEDRGSLTSGCGGRITLDRTLRVSANKHSLCLNSQMPVTLRLKNSIHVGAKAATEKLGRHDPILWKIIYTSALHPQRMPTSSTRPHVSTCRVPSTTPSPSSHPSTFTTVS